MVLNYNKFKILVCGSSGMLGKAFTDLSKDIFTIIPTSYKLNDNHLCLDITNSTNVKNVICEWNPDIILNCAAFTNVDKAENNKSLAHKVNVEGLNNLIKYSKKNTKIINISSDYVFDGIKGDYDELSLPNPINYYGKTKHEADNILMSSNRKYLIFRINGLFSSTNNNNFFNWVYKSLQKNIKINVVLDQISNPTYVNDLVKIIIDSIILNVDVLYNYGTNNNVSKFKFANLIAKNYKFNQELINPVYTCDLNQIASRPLNTNLKCDKIIENIDVELQSLHKIIKGVN